MMFPCFPELPDSEEWQELPSPQSDQLCWIPVQNLTLRVGQQQKTHQKDLITLPKDIIFIIIIMIFHVICLFLPIVVMVMIMSLTNNFVPGVEKSENCLSSLFT